MSEFSSVGRRPILQRRNSLTNFFQAVLDGLAVIFVTSSLVYFHKGYFTPEYTILLVLLLGILAIAFDQLAVYRNNSSFTIKALRILQSWVSSIFVLVLIAFLTKQADYFSRLLIGELFLIGLFTHIGLHYGFYRLQKTLVARQDAENVLILGSGDLAEYVALKIRNNPWLGQNPVGKVTLDDQSEKPEIEFGKEPLVSLGAVSKLSEIISTHNIGSVYIVTPLEGFKQFEKIYFKLLDSHIAIHWIPDIFSLRLVNHSVNEIAGIPVLTLSQTPLTGTWLLAKALEDRLLSLILLFLASPVLLLVALMVKLDSPGPVLFRQERMGWNGKVFKIFKFRSMYTHQPEGGGVRQAEKGDPRITRVGGFLRRTSLDELPQLLNVFFGDMSLVGPRPHAVQHDEEYSQRIADYFARHKIKPGITGLAQVRGMRGETREIGQMVQRIESDIEYINNWSLWLDLVILVRTLGAFTGKNAY